jgi:hypothetical protein
MRQAACAIRTLSVAASPNILMVYVCRKAAIPLNDINALAEVADGTVVIRSVR